MKVRFGTDGWRALIDEDFNEANVALLAQAVANYLHKFEKCKKVAVGYDTRRKSEFFAQVVAEVLAGNGLQVLYPQKFLPTPALAYIVLKRKLAGAVMITASHNPPEWNGFKFIPSHAGPALPHETSAVEQEIMAVSYRAVSRLPFEKGASRGIIAYCDPIDEYIGWVTSLLDRDLFKRRRLKVVVDPMYGASCGYLDYALSAVGCDVKVVHGTPDPTFGGLHPEPTEKNLRELAREVVRYGADLGLATDGDADRVGVCDANGAFISPNQLFPLLYLHLIEFKGQRGNVARTVATTHLVDQVAAHYGYRHLETPVGFKYIGELLRRKEAVIGGEESGGFGIASHVSEKDGILASLLVAELKASLGFTLSSRLSQVYESFGFRVSGRIDVKCERGREVVERIRQAPPSEIQQSRVLDVITIDGVKFLLENGNWLLIRASGTEPLVRVYAEAKSKEELAELLNYGNYLVNKTLMTLT